MATEVKLPEVGEGIEAGTVVAVLVQPGDHVQKDQPLVELETDKAVVEIPSTVAGVVSKVNVEENQEAAVGSVLVVIDEGASAQADAAKTTTEEPGKEEAKQDASTDAKEVAKEVAKDDAKGPSEAPAEEPAEGDGKERRAAEAPSRDGGAPANAKAGGSGDATDDGRARLVPAAPSVRRLARELGVDVRNVRGSGVLGRISAADVRSMADGGAPAGAPASGAGGAAGTAQAPQVTLPDFSRWGEVERTPMSGIRKATVRAMSTAWATVPMVTHFDEADITELERTRKRYQPMAQAEGAKLTPTAILLKVVAAALRRFPDFNASIDTGAMEIVHKKYVNIGVAVDTDAGLLVPVVKNADRKNIIALAKELGEMAEKARDRKLTPDEMQGGNFSISNLGGIGGTGFTPIVNPPDVAILGVSRASMKPVWDKEQGEFAARMIMPLALTYDHRLIDGAAAARFLRWVCSALEEPFLVALEG
ncbi:MAG: 2-oxo acid dehydrogenase subunit E2 [Trueperaceae bacterium]